MANITKRIGYAIGYLLSLITTQKFIGILLLLPAFNVIISLLQMPGQTTIINSFDSGWEKYFFSHLDRTMEGAPLSEQNLSISLIIIAMTFAGAYLIKSKSERKH